MDGRKVSLKAGAVGLVFLGSLAPIAPAMTPAVADQSAASYVVADTACTDGSCAAADVIGAGGTVLEQLNSASGVLASLTSPQVSQLIAMPTVTVTPDAIVAPMALGETLSGSAPAAVFPQQTGATQLWAKNITGVGVNVAVVDTGVDNLPDFYGRLLPGVDFTSTNNPNDDEYGHGTFVAGLIAGDGASSGGQYTGEAPGAGIVPVKVAGATGQTDVATVIEGIDWVIQHRVAENIRVMNLSLGWPSGESSTVNPLDQAVERAWDAGIVVVDSAGNSGPYNGTIVSPGDDPLAITVGAVNDQGSTQESSDTAETFSSVGPTPVDGWPKPDLATSGTSVVSLMAPGSTIAQDNPQAVVGNANFVGSGTSFSSAITAGAAALLLQARHALQPSEVKARLLGTADRGPVGDPYVDGHGLLDVAAAASAPNYQLEQDFGQLSASGRPVPGVLTPGQSLEGGYAVMMSNRHPASAVTFTGGEIDLPVACQNNGPQVGIIEVDLPSATYSFPANATSPTNIANAYQGTATVGDFCAGGPLYPAEAGANGGLVSRDTTDPVQVQFTVSAGSRPSPAGNTSAVPAPQTVPGQAVDEGAVWQSSSWNPAMWRGLPPTATASSSPVTSVNGSTLTGASFNGSVWNGHTWNGSVWNGQTWNGSTWNGQTWNGSTWNGSVWNGSTWNGSVWNGAVWNGSVWNGSSWSPLGSAFDGTPAAGSI